jgi:hypothetical protein
MGIETLMQPPHSARTALCGMVFQRAGAFYMMAVIKNAVKEEYKGV